MVELEIGRSVSMKPVVLFAALTLVVTACGSDASAPGAGEMADPDLAGVEFVVHQAPG